MAQQAKLLRVLESGEYEVLGSSQTQHTDIRIISASNGDFSKLIEDEKFREDLFYRLNTLEFRVPSLKQRQSDIIPLAEHFIQMFSHKYKKEQLQLSAESVQTLNAYHWPGNIRELSHLMERAVLLSKNNEIKLNELNSLALKVDDTLPLMTLEQAEIKLLKQALASCDNNIPKAAALLGLTKSSMYRRLEKYDDIQK